MNPYESHRAFERTFALHRHTCLARREVLDRPSKLRRDREGLRVLANTDEASVKAHRQFGPAIVPSERHASQAPWKRIGARTTALRLLVYWTAKGAMQRSLLDRMRIC